MLRVGLTGGLSSGKSTAAAIFQALGANILSSDEIGRALMQPGESVFDAIVAAFGPEVLLDDGTLNRAALAKLAFAGGRAEELNGIVHPAVIDRQAELAEAIALRDPHTVVLVESALLFETKYRETKYRETKYRETKYREMKYGGEEGWRRRFDRLVLVTAPEELRIGRFVARSTAGRTPLPDELAALEAEAHRRIAQQLPDEQKAALCDYVLTNSGAVTELEWQIDQLWPLLRNAAAQSSARAG